MLSEAASCCLNHELGHCKVPTDTQGQWQGKPVLVTSKLVPRILWQTASIDVSIDGERILRTGGKFKYKGAHADRFRRSGAQHEAVLAWGISGLRSFPVQLSIDGEPVLESRVHISNWPLSLWPLAIPLALLLYWAR